MPKTFINGIDLYYNLYGSGASLVLIHGLGADQTLWDLQTPRFSQDFQVIVYDLRGHGQSESPDDPYSIELFADDLHHFLRHLGLKKAMILGLSLGGRIALKFSLKYSQETRALILADTQSEAPEENKKQFLLAADMAGKEGMEKVAEMFFSRPFFQGLAKADPSRFKKEKARFAQSSAIGFAQSCLAIVRMERLTAFLTEIKAPTLALAGEEDGPYLPFLDLYAASIPQCKIVKIPRAGHISNLENPEAFNKSVYNFLNSLTSP
jgi:3-oxoadipate enol-lactonase